MIPSSFYGPAAVDALPGMESMALAAQVPPEAADPAQLAMASMPASAYPPLEMGGVPTTWQSLAAPSGAPLPASAGGDAPPAVDPASASDPLMDAINAKQMDSIRQQQAGIDQGQAQAAALAGMPLQTDLSPLMNLSDTWFGGNLQKGYAKPETGRERIGTAQALQNAIQKQMGGLTESELGLLKQKLGERQHGADLKARYAEIQQRREAAAMAKQDAKSTREDWKTMEAKASFDREYGPGISQSVLFEGAAKNVQDILAKHQGNIPDASDPDYALLEANFSTMKTSYNKGVAGLGALAGADLGMLAEALGDPTVSVSAYLKNKIRGGGTTTGAIIEQMRRINKDTVKTIRDRAHVRYEGRIDDLGDQYGKEMSAAGGSAPETKEQSVTPEALKTMTREQKLELAKKRGLIP